MTGCGAHVGGRIVAPIITVGRRCWKHPAPGNGDEHSDAVEKRTHAHPRGVPRVDPPCPHTTGDERMTDDTYTIPVDRVDDVRAVLTRALMGACCGVQDMTAREAIDALDTIAGTYFVLSAVGVPGDTVNEWQVTHNAEWTRTVADVARAVELEYDDWAASMDDSTNPDEHEYAVTYRQHAAQARRVLDALPAQVAA